MYLMKAKSTYQNKTPTRCLRIAIGKWLDVMKFRERLAEACQHVFFSFLKLIVIVPMKFFFFSETDPVGLFWWFRLHSNYTYKLHVDGDDKNVVKTLLSKMNTKYHLRLA